MPNTLAISSGAPEEKPSAYRRFSSWVSACFRRKTSAAVALAPALTDEALPSAEASESPPPLSCARKILVGFLVCIFGGGKIAQSGGQALFAASQGQGILPDALANEVLNNTVAVSSSLVSGSTRLPRMFGFFRLKLSPRSPLPDLERGEAERMRALALESVKPSCFQRFKSFFSTPLMLQSQLARKITYGVLKTIFSVFGGISLLATTLIGFQSGSLFIRQVWKLFSKVCPLGVEGGFGVYIAICTFWNYFTFNFLRIANRSHDTAFSVAQIGLWHMTRREKISFTVSALLALFYAPSSFGFSIVSTRGALSAFAKTFLSGSAVLQKFSASFSLFFSIPALTSTLLTGCADLYDILAGHSELRHLPKGRAFLAVSFALLALVFGVATLGDTLGNGIGFFGSAVSLLGALGWNGFGQKIFSGVAALLSALPYMGNNGLLIFFTRKTQVPAISIAASVPAPSEAQQRLLSGDDGPDSMDAGAGIGDSPRTLMGRDSPLAQAVSGIRAALRDEDSSLTTLSVSLASTPPDTAEESSPRLV